MQKIFLLFFLTLTTLFSSQIGVVYGLDPNNDGFLSLRVQPKSTKIGKLYNGDTLEILDRSGKYYKVKDIKSSQIGWAHSNWIRIDNTFIKMKSQKVVSYFAKLSQRDHYNVQSGKKITDVAYIIQQDRANYHKYKKRDSEDTGDGFFDILDNRKRIKGMIERGNISQQTKDQILNGTPYVKVTVRGNRMDVEHINSVSHMNSIETSNSDTKDKEIMLSSAVDIKQAVQNNIDVILEKIYIIVDETSQVLPSKDLLVSSLTYVLPIIIGIFITIYLFRYYRKRRKELIRKNKELDALLTQMINKRENFGKIVSLIKQGAEINDSIDNIEDLLLYYSTKSAGIKIVEVLLKYGADIEAKDEYGKNPLIYAAEKGHIEIVKLLLEKGTDIEAADKDGSTALILATKEGEKEIVKLLLDKGADIDAANKNGWTALILATRKGHREIIELLLDKGADTEAVDKDGSTALILATKEGEKEIVKLLLEKGADIEATAHGWTALMLASENGNKEIVKFLLEKGAATETVNNDGTTALMFAAEEGEREIVKLFLDKGADIDAANKNGWTALILATRKGHREIIELLLDKGADTEAVNHDGTSALMFAAAKGHKEIVELLLEKGTDIDAANENGWTALMFAAEKGEKEIIQLLLAHGAILDINDTTMIGKVTRELFGKEYHTFIDAITHGKQEAVIFFLDKGTDIDAANKSGTTALMFAVAKRHKEIVELLLEKGADIDATNKNGWTALMFAAEEGEREIVKLFLDKGADIDAANKNGWTALMFAIRKGHTEIVELLLDKGADTGVIDNDGYTALILATRKGHREIIELLLEKGADSDAKNKNGWTALMFAAEKGEKETVQLLMAHGATLNINSTTMVGKVTRVLFGKEYHTINDAIRDGEQKVIQFLFEYGGDIDAVDKDGRTPLMYASILGEKEIVKFLLDKGANIEAADKNGWTALMRATRYGVKEIVKLLLDKGANINVVDKNGTTVLMVAADNDEKGIIQLLLEYGATLDINDTTMVGKVTRVMFEKESNDILDAAKNGNKEIVQFLLKHGADIEAKNQYGTTALISAAREGHEEIVKLLLERGSAIGAVDKNGTTVLMFAAREGHTEIVEFLLDKGADIDAVDKNGTTALMFAAREGHTEIVEFLLDKGADIDADGTTALIVAAANEHKEIVKLLLEKGADIDAANKNGTTALIVAARSGHTEIVKLLLEKGAATGEIDNDGYTALISAAANGLKEIVKLLLEKGADSNAKMKNGLTALIFASAKGEKEVVQFLLDHGATLDINNTAIVGNVTRVLFGEAYHNINDAIKDGEQEVIQFLLEYGGDIDAVDKDGRTPLMYASILGKKEIAKFLLDKGADIEAKDNKGRSSLALALENEYISIATLLIQHNATVDLNIEIESAVNGISELLDAIVSRKKNQIFNTPVNTIMFDDYDKITLSINDLEKDVEITDFGVRVEYIPNQSKYIDWPQKSNIIQKLFKTNRIELFDNLNGKYGIYFFNQSVEADLLLDLKVENQKPHLVNLLEIHHSKVFLFENINGVGLQSWKKEEQLIEDILGMPVDIDYYDRTHSLYDPKISTDKLIIIQEEAISVLPKKLNLNGSFLKFQEENGYEKYYFQDISKESYAQWQESISKISEYLNSKFEIHEYDEVNGIIVIVNATEERLPDLLEIQDDNGNTPTLIYSKEVDGNRYFYYSDLPTVKFELWNKKIKSNSLQAIFNKPTAVYKLIDCDSNSVDFDDILKEKGYSQVVLLKELTAVPKVCFMKEDSFLKDEKVFWGYGAGGLKYYTDMNDAMHMMVIGGTGSGKSTLMNGLLLSLIHNIHLVGKLYLIDLKSGIEFNKYSKLDSEKITVFSDNTKPSKLLSALKEVEAQMHLRQKYMGEKGIVKITEEPIFIVVDEFAQIALMHADSGEERKAKQEIMNTLLKIGSLARASNIKLFIQTQDPSSVSGDLQNHLLFRILLKTGSSRDVNKTLQSPEELDVLGLKHVKFGRGRFVFEEYDGNDTKLTELQFPLLVKTDTKGEMIRDDKGNVTANLYYFMKYKEDAISNISALDKKMLPYIDVVRNAYPYLENTKTLRHKEYSDQMVSKSDDNKESQITSPLDSKFDEVKEKLGIKDKDLEDFDWNAIE